MQSLPYLQPKSFVIPHKGFNYEFVVCHEYYADASGSSNPADDIDFTGNFLITMLTPQGTFQIVVEPADEAPADNISALDNELYKKLLSQLSR